MSGARWLSGGVKLESYLQGVDIEQVAPAGDFRVRKTGFERSEETAGGAEVGYAGRRGDSGAWGENRDQFRTRAEGGEGSESQRRTDDDGDPLGGQDGFNSTAEFMV